MAGAQEVPDAAILTMWMPYSTVSLRQGTRNANEEGKTLKGIVQTQKVELVGAKTAWTRIAEMRWSIVLKMSHQTCLVRIKRRIMT